MAYVFDGDVLTQQLFLAEDYKSPMDGALLKAILNNNVPSTSIRYPIASIPEYLNRVYTNTYAKQAYDYLNHARYFHSDTIPSNINGEDINEDGVEGPNYVDPHPDIKEIIEDEIGEEIQIEHYQFSKPVPLMLAKDYFIRSPENKYSVPLGASTRYRTYAFYELSTGKPYTVIDASHIGTTVTVTAIEMIYLDGSGEAGVVGWFPDYENPKEFTLDLTLTNSIQPVHRVHHIRYKTKSESRTGFWFYNETVIGNVAPYENIFGSAEFISTFDNQSFPFAMIIEEGKQVIKGHMGDAYKQQTEDLLNKINLDLSTLMDGLSGPPRNPDLPEDPVTNPAGDVNKDIKDAFVHYSCNMDSEENGSLQYIYEHFRQYYINNQQEMDDAHEYWFNNYDNPNISWQAKFMNGGGMTFANNRIQFRMRFRWISMNIKKGLVTDSFPTRPNEAYLNDVTYNAVNIDSSNTGKTSIQWSNGGTADDGGNKIEVGKITRHIFEGNEYIEETDNPQELNDHLYILRKQLTAGDDGSISGTVVKPTYVEMVIMGPTQSTRLINHHGTFSTGGGEVINIINRITETEDGKFFLPISVEVLDRFDKITQSEILFQALSLTITTYSATKLKWYQDSNFMMAIRIAISLVTMGSSEVFLQSIYEIVQQVAINAAINYAIGQAIVLLVDALGLENTMILAVIAVIAAAVAKNNGVQGIFDKLFKLINAEGFLNMSNLAMDLVNTAVALEYGELQERIDEYKQIQEEREEELQELEKQLDIGTDIDLVESLTRRSLPNFYETPTDFYNRTVHTTNPGVLSLDTIDTYVGANLILPKNIT